MRECDDVGARRKKSWPDGLVELGGLRRLLQLGRLWYRSPRASVGEQAQLEHGATRDATALLS